jgi:S-adenosylmethionine hydrolase
MMNMRATFIFLVWVASINCYAQNVLVFQSDFGLKDGAVAAMKGVAVSVSPNLNLYDLTHEIPAYNIWEASYRLYQAITYWPKGTVFVSIVDPGVGSSRRSVVVKTASGHFIVTPDNGTLTLVADNVGIVEVRQIDEAINRLKNSEQSYTFHGRDVYAYTGARLATGVISFEQVGEKLSSTVTILPYQKPVLESKLIRGNIPVLDVQYGNVWSNVDASLVQSLGIKPGDQVQVTIYSSEKIVFKETMPFVNTFADVPVGNNMAYLNSLLNLSFCINQGNFAEKYKVSSGAEWSVRIKKM